MCMFGVWLMPLCLGGNRWFPGRGKGGKTKPPDDSGRLGGALVDPTTRADYEFDSEDAVAFILPDVVQECYRNRHSSHNRRACKGKGEVAKSLGVQKVTGRCQNLVCGSWEGSDLEGIIIICVNK